MPEDLTAVYPPTLAADELELLQLVWDELDRTGNWPTFQAIDRTLLNRDDDADLAELIARIPKDLLHGGRPSGGARADPDGSLSLTIDGAAVCSGTERVLQVAIAAARIGAAQFRKGPAHPAEVTFDLVVEELELDLPDAERKELGRRSAKLLANEPWKSQSTINENGWTVSLDRDIRFYRGVATFEEYWRGRERQRAAQRAAVPGPIWAPVSDSAGRAVTAQSDSVPSPEPSAPEAEQPPAAGRVVNNYIYASSNLAIDSTDVKQTMKPPATGGSEKPAEQLQHPASLSSAPDEALARGSHPAMVLVVSVVGAFGIVPAVIQATKATWAQITSASLVVLTVALLVLCWFQWNRRPRARKAGLVIAAVFALGIGAVLILGNL